MKKYIIPSSIVLLIVAGLLLITFKNTSDQRSVQTQIQQEVKIETKTETQTNTGELTTDDILSQLDEQVEIIEPEVDENNEPEIVSKPEPKVEPVIIEKPKPVVVSVPKSEPKVIIAEPDFQPNEYFRNSEDEAPQVYRYEPKPEWFIPDGNPEEFSMDSSKELRNAYGTNYKHLSISINRSYVGTETTNLPGFSRLIQQYTDKPFYFVGDNEEEQGLWRIHIEVTPEESINLMKELKSDSKIDRVRQMGDILPQFKHQRDEIIRKYDDFSIF